MTPATLPEVQLGRTIGESHLGSAPPPVALPGGPNVVVILLDDVGFCQLGSFGSDRRHAQH